MKVNIIFIIVAILLNGCGVFNKVSKHSTASSMKAELSKKEMVNKYIHTTDRTITTITERLDTGITTPMIYGKSENRITLAKLQNGFNILDDEFIVLHQIYNPIDSTIKTGYTLKPQKVIVPKERKKEIHSNVETIDDTHASLSTNKKKAIKSSDVIVERKTDYKGALMLVIILFGLFYLIKWQMT